MLHARPICQHCFEREYLPGLAPTAMATSLEPASPRNAHSGEGFVRHCLQHATHINGQLHLGNIRVRWYSIIVSNMDQELPKLVQVLAALLPGT